MSATAENDKTLSLAVQKLAELSALASQLGVLWCEIVDLDEFGVAHYMPEKITLTLVRDGNPETHLFKPKERTMGAKEANPPPENSIKLTPPPQPPPKKCCCNNQELQELTMMNVNSDPARWKVVTHIVKTPYTPPEGSVILQIRSIEGPNKAKVRLKRFDIKTDKG